MFERILSWFSSSYSIMQQLEDDYDDDSVTSLKRPIMGVYLFFSSRCVKLRVDGR